jgi:hypothetical protein
MKRTNVQINQRDATLLTNELYYPLIGCTCFGLSPVHQQEHHIINCIRVCYVRAGESSVAFTQQLIVQGLTLTSVNCSTVCQYQFLGQPSDGHYPEPAESGSQLKYNNV